MAITIERCKARRTCHKCGVKIEMGKFAIVDAGPGKRIVMCPICGHGIIQDKLKAHMEAAQSCRMALNMLYNAPQDTKRDGGYVKDVNRLKSGPKRKEIEL